MSQDKIVNDTELVSGILGNVIEINHGGEAFELHFKSQKMSVTRVQAKVIADSLTDYSNEWEVAEEVAEKTRRWLMDSFDFDESELSTFGEEA